MSISIIGCKCFKQKKNSNVLVLIAVFNLQMSTVTIEDALNGVMNWNNEF